MVQKIAWIQKSHKAVDAFVNGLSVIPIFGCIKLYAKEKVRLRKIGKPMHDEFDLLIGVTAKENKLVLVTDNTRHFNQIDGIKIENWFKRTSLLSHAPHDIYSWVYQLQNSSFNQLV